MKIHESHLKDLRSKTKHRIDKNGYRLVHVPGHPLAWRTGWLSEHRLVAYETHKATSTSASDPVACAYCGYEVPWRSPMGMKYCVNVDHRNGDRLDNRSENLWISCYSCNINRKYEQVDELVFKDFCKSFSTMHPADRPNARGFFEEQLRQIRKTDGYSTDQKIRVSDELLNALYVYGRACSYEPYEHLSPVDSLLCLMTGLPWGSGEPWFNDDGSESRRWLRLDSASMSGVREPWRGVLGFDCAVTLRQFPALSRHFMLSRLDFIGLLELAALLEGEDMFSDSFSNRIDWLCHPFYHQRPGEKEARQEWNHMVGEEVERLIGRAK